jgi:hypothetical protein
MAFYSFVPGETWLVCFAAVFLESHTLNEKRCAINRGKSIHCGYDNV